MSRWSGFTVMALLLLGAVAASLEFAAYVPAGAALEPTELELRPGGSARLRVVLHEPGLAAVSFRLRFDARVVRVEPTAEPTAILAADGRALRLPVRRSPGLLDVPGLAAAGGRTFPPHEALYEMRIEGLEVGTTVIRAEDFVAADTDAVARPIAVAPTRVTVRRS